MKQVQYAAVIEEVEDGYSGYFPDVPGCIAVGETIDEVMENLSTALAFHLEGLKEDGLELPRPRSVAREVRSTVAS